MKYKAKTKILLMVLFLFPAAVLQAQNLGIKTNFFYAGYTKTPNIAGELGLGGRSTLEVGAGYNPWNYNGTEENNKKLVHLLGAVEYRYWFCEKFNGHFVGVHTLGAMYNIAQYEIPLLFGKGSKEFRYEGWAAGAGVSYGYQFLLSKHWNLETNIGFGYIYLSYDKYECKKCGTSIGSAKRDYMGPTKAALALIYTF